MALRRFSTALAVLAFGGATVLAQSPTPAPPPESRQDTDTRSELSDESREAIRSGLGRLVGLQTKAGGWSGGEFYVAVTSHAGLALLAAGEQPDRGVYAAPLRRAIETILANQARTGVYKGLFYDGSPGPLGSEHRPMHGHGFALLFLAEAYGQTGNEELRRRLHAAIKEGVRCSERAQSPQGGWYYLPDSRRDEGSVTVTQVQGLRAARDAGVVVDKSTIDRAIEYIRKSQDADGGIRYMLERGPSSAALTAAGMTVLNGAGVYADDALDRGFKYLRQARDTDDEHRFYYYKVFYLVQALHQRGGPEWAQGYPRLRDQVLRKRSPGGTWDDPLVGKAYGTACALLVLEVPLRYLPIFQR